MIQEHHTELVSFELAVQLSAKIAGVARVTETGLFVLGHTGAIKVMLILQIDRLTIIINSPNATGFDYLVAFVSFFVNKF